MKKYTVITKLLIFTWFATASVSSASLHAGSFDVVSTRGMHHPAVRRMLAHLQSDDPFVRVSAVQGLGELGEVETMAALICALKDENLYVRAYTAEALAKLHNSSAVQPLIGAIKDKDFFVRVHVVKAMGELRDPKTVDPLLALLQGDNHAIKPYAAWALGEIRDPVVVRPLIEALKDQACCAQAADALRKITKEDLGSNYEAWHRWWFTTH